MGCSHTHRQELQSLQYIWIRHCQTYINIYKVDILDIFPSSSDKWQGGLLPRVLFYFFIKIHMFVILKNYWWNLNNAKTKKIRINKKITKESKIFESDRISENFSYLIVLAQRIIIWNLIIILLVSKIQDE